MKTDFWLERWEKNQIGFHEDDVNPYLIDYSSNLEVSEGDSIFVPLCGKSKDMLWLSNQGLNVIGIELSEIAVRDFFEENNLQPQVEKKGKFEYWSHGNIVILLGDFFDLTKEDIKDCTAIYDRASLIAMPENMRSDYASHIKTITPEGTKTLLITLDYPQDEMNGPPFSVDTKQVEAFYQDTYQIEILHSNEQALEENSNFKSRGLTSLKEHVYLLKFNT